MSSDFVISNTIKITGNSRNTILKLKGILYYGDYHFTMQMFENNGNVWFHDGQHNDGKITNISSSGMQSHLLNECDGKKALMAIYCH